MDIEKLIGMHVMHTKGKKKGKILNIMGNIMEVDFHGEIKKMSFPYCFQKDLILENEEFQQELKNAGSFSAFCSFKESYYRAIEKEINHIKTTGGKRKTLTDGKKIDFSGNTYIYIFETDEDIRLMEDLPIKLWFSNKVVNAHVISSENYSLTFRTNENLGSSIKAIEYTSDSSLLLEELNKRMESLDVKKDEFAYQIACTGTSKASKMELIKKGQTNAIKRGLSDAITFIWGPPGTGKTYTLAKISAESMRKGKRVLMLSYSNVSVDGALLRVAEMCDFEAGKAVRYGYPRIPEIKESETLNTYKLALHNNPSLENSENELYNEKKKLTRRDVKTSKKRTELDIAINKIRKRIKREEEEIIGNAQFIATTVSKAVVDPVIYRNKYDVVIFDEASMAYVPQVVFAASLAKSNFICLGDFRQLPAICQCKENDLLEKDIFAYTGVTQAVEGGCSHDWLIMLDCQYRMHPNIAWFVDDIMYGGNLNTAEEIKKKRDELSKLKPISSESMVLLDLSNMYSVCSCSKDGSRFNILSAFLCVLIAGTFANESQVGIITPYSVQSRLMNAIIRDLSEGDKNYQNIVCATVHQFQGSEKPIIVYDTVDCYRMPYPGGLLTSSKNHEADRLFNVALTRAQGKFILVTNKDYFYRKKLSKKLMLRKAIDYMSENHCTLKGNEIFNEMHDFKNSRDIKFYRTIESSWEQFCNDLIHAKESIQIDIPGELYNENDEIEQFATIIEKQVKRSIKISIRFDTDVILPKTVRRYAKKETYVTNPVTIIDQKMCWFGQPLAMPDFIVDDGTLIETKYFPCIRFIGEHAIKLINRLL